MIRQARDRGSRHGGIVARPGGSLRGGLGRVHAGGPGSRPGHGVLDPRPLVRRDPGDGVRQRVRPATGFPTGVVDLTTSCGGSGRGGGYHTTTYTASADVVWDWTATVVSTAVPATGATVPGFSATDANGNQVYDSGTGAFLLLLAPGFTPTPRVTAVSAAEGPAAGGTPVVITGTGFTGATQVGLRRHAGGQLHHHRRQLDHRGRSAGSGRHRRRLGDLGRRDRRDGRLRPVHLRGRARHHLAQPGVGPPPGG